MNPWRDLRAALAQKFPEEGVRKDKVKAKPKVKGKRGGGRSKTKLPKQSLADAQAAQRQVDGHERHVGNAKTRQFLAAHALHRNRLPVGRIASLRVPHVLPASAKVLRNQKALRPFIATHGALAIDQSHFVCLEVNISSTALRQQLFECMPHIELSLYRREGRAWQGMFGQTVAPVVAFWLNSEALVVSMHWLACSALPSWFLEASTPLDLASIDLLGPQAFKKLTQVIKPTTDLHNQLWQACGALPMWLFPTNSVLHFAAEFANAVGDKPQHALRALDHNRMKHRVDRLVSLAKQETIADTTKDSLLLRILFIDNEHIRVLVDLEHVLPLWQQLMNRRVVGGTEREMRRWCLEYGRPSFPYDYPETVPGAEFWSDPRNLIFGTMPLPMDLLPIKRVLVRTHGPVPYAGTKLLNIHTREWVGVVTTGRLPKTKTGAIQHGIAVVKQDLTDAHCFCQYYGSTVDFVAELEPIIDNKLMKH